MNPETTRVWHPLKERLDTLYKSCLQAGVAPPDWCRIENVAGSGTPDVNWMWRGRHGWIELKYRGLPPVGASTPCVIESITAHQRLWWRQRHEAGGLVHVLTRVGNDWFLHTGDWARRFLGSTTIAEMRAANLLPVGTTLPQADILLELCK